MNRLQAYLNGVDPVLAFSMFLAGAAIMLLLRGEKRWLVPIAISPTWLLMNRMSDFSTLGVFLKVFAIVPLVIAGFEANRCKLPKNNFPALLGPTLFVGLLWILCIGTTRDVVYGTTVRVQWITMAIVAASLARLCGDPRQLRLIVASVFWGCLFASMLMASALLLDGNAMNLNGHTRFSPWGSNPNQINMLLVVGYLSSVYMLVRPNPRWVVGLAIGSAMATSLMLLLTLSRSSIGMAAIGTFIVGPQLFRKRPVLILAVGVAAAAAIVWYISSKGIHLTRLSSLESGRTQIARLYWYEMSKRPLTGLLGTKGYSFYSAPGTSSHAHNVFLILGYNGGIVLAGSFLFVIIRSLMLLSNLYWNRHRQESTSLEICWMLAVFAALTASTFNNFSIVWSSYFASFLYLLIGMTASMLSASTLLSQMPSAPRPIRLQTSHQSSLLRN